MKTEELYKLFLQHPVISTDSRKISPGSIYFGLRGERFDGNLFARDAIEAGAEFAILDNPDFISGPRCLLVDNVLQSLQGLALFHRKQINIPVIGITGTNGKTTTKELLHAVLSQKFNTIATEGNLNNHIGVPLTILRLKTETEITVIEMGANHPGEIAGLCEIALPDYGLITNIGVAHLEGFGDQESIISTKKALYDHVKENGKNLFVNAGNPLLMNLSEEIQRVTYGDVPSSWCKGRILGADPFLRIEIRVEKDSFVLESNLAGTYNFENILSAACTGLYFGVSPSQVASAIREYRPDNNRSQVMQTVHNLLVLDAYNANPSSMKVALQNFSGMAAPSKMLILGDMLELGAASENEHAKILEMLPGLGFTNVILIGPVFSAVNKNTTFMTFKDSDAAAHYLSLNQPKEMCILLKGSRGIRVEKTVEFL